MKRHRSISRILTLGLSALVGLAAHECSAGTLTITVFGGGLPVAGYTTTGTAQSVTVDVDELDAMLKAAGSAYSFSSLGAVSDYAGQTGSVGAYLNTSGTVSVSATGGSTSALTIFTSEDGWTSPTAVSTSRLVDTATANYTGLAADSLRRTSATTDFAGFIDSSSPAVSAVTLGFALNANGTVNDVHSGSASTAFGKYLTPFDLSNTLTVELTPRTKNTPGSDSFSGVTSLTTNPEPASLVMMLVGISVVILTLRRSAIGIIDRAPAP